MASKTTIEERVMANVGTIYVGRTLTGTTALKVYALILSVWMLGRLVWVAKISQNFWNIEKHGLGSLSNYFVYSLEHTHLAVQLTLLVAAVAFVGLIIDTVRSLAQPRHLSI